MPSMRSRRFCPLCERSAWRFEALRAGSPDRGRCPHCGSLQRHRLLWLYLRDHTDLLHAPRKRVLHWAPEPALGDRLAATEAIDYVSADLEPGAAELVLDISDIDLPDDSVDVVICVHVLEHVPDDRRALRELRRILRPGGWAVLQVPIQVTETDEDVTETSPAVRLERFGQEDHVRRYGEDFFDRVRDAGFHVEIHDCRAWLTPRDIERCVLDYDYEWMRGVDGTWHVYRADVPAAV